MKQNEYPVTIEALVQRIKNGDKVVRHSYYFDEMDSDSWIEYNDEELEFGDIEMEQILEIIEQAEKEGLIEFIGWKSGEYSQTETVQLKK